MLLESKKNRLLEFKSWVDLITVQSKYTINLVGDAKKHLKQHITNPINLKRIKKNIEYIVNDPLNIKGLAPNDWHRLSYFKKRDKIVYTMDINGKDRMSYIVDDNVIIFSMLGHQE